MAEVATLVSELTVGVAEAIETELVRERRDRLGRGRRPQHGLRRIARQDLHDREHDQRRDE